jgi:hypothetical protein
MGGRDLNVWNDLNYLNYLRPSLRLKGVLVQTRSKIGNPKSQIASLAIALFAMLLSWPNLADAQQTKKVPRIGYLSPRHGIEPREEAFRKGLRELGYIEGENVIIEWRFTEGKRERQVDLATELVRLKVDCIVTAGTAATHAAKQATSTIPIVMTNVGDDPVRQGFVASLARPEGNYGIYHHGRRSSWQTAGISQGGLPKGFPHCHPLGFDQSGSRSLC